MKKITEFNKRFANGEQFLIINHEGQIEEVYKSYFWQEREVYNRIIPLVELIKSKYPSISDSELYGSKGLVNLLVPIQRAYNDLKNRKHEYLNRLMLGVIVVEDGSIDTDSLEDEGLSAGKVLIYRQGSAVPQFLKEENIIPLIEREEDRLIGEFHNIYTGFELRMKIKEKQNENNTKRILGKQRKTCNTL